MNFIIEVTKFIPKNVEMNAMFMIDINSPINGTFINIPKVNIHKIIKAIIYNILLIPELYFPKLYFKIFKTFFILLLLLQSTLQILSYKFHQLIIYIFLSALQHLQILLFSHLLKKQLHQIFSRVLQYNE